MLFTANAKDITALIGNLTLTSDSDTLGDELDFDTPYSDMYYFPKQKISVGDIVQLFDDTQKEVFRGIIVSMERTDETQSFTCFDFAFYLNKSKIIKQFYNIRADKAIQELLKECSVPYGEIADIPTVISKIYYDKEVSEVIKDMLNMATGESGKRYFMEMNAGNLCIMEEKERLLSCTIKLADNIAPMDITETISSPSYTESMEDMKNSIVLYTGDEENIKMIAQAENSSLIAKYGLLQETKGIEEKEIAQANFIAQNMLAESGKLTTGATITVLGNFELRANRTILVEEPVTGLSGKYKIRNASHSVGKIHTCALELEAV